MAQGGVLEMDGKSQFSTLRGYQVVIIIVLQRIVDNPNVAFMADLIKQDGKEWNEGLITNLFIEDDVKRILQITLPTAPRDDAMGL